jgi:hypothetical protein
MDARSTPCLLVSLSPCLRCLMICAALALTGCPRKEQPHAPATAPRESVALRVLVVNEPGVAETINQLRGEWTERSGGALTATNKSWVDVAKAKNLDTDVIIFPSRYMGELCAREWLRPVRSSVLESDEFKADDVFPLVRRELIQWGGEVMALPLAIDLVLPGKKYDDHPGIVILAEAAPDAVSSEREGALFDPRTMKPRIDSPAFVRALERIAESMQKKAKLETDFARYIPVLGYDDRLVSVISASRNGASAFKLIAWLASPEISSQLEKSGGRMRSPRKSPAARSAVDHAATDVQQGANRGRKLEAVLSGDKCLVIPRIPAVDEYLSTLDDAISAAAAAKTPPTAALQQASQKWEQITDKLGREKQRQAILKHMGISE